MIDPRIKEYLQSGNVDCLDFEINKEIDFTLLDVFERSLVENLLLGNVSTDDVKDQIKIEHFNNFNAQWIMTNNIFRFIKKFDRRNHSLVALMEFENELHGKVLSLSLASTDANIESLPSNRKSNDTSTALQYILLQELGIIEYLNNKFTLSKDGKKPTLTKVKLAELISKILGKTNTRNYLTHIGNPNKNVKYYSKENVSIIKKFFSELGLNELSDKVKVTSKKK